ncbi:carboxypeptidase-like regulatory domain-containing protein [Porphyromonas gulae]|uniref:carboxypeptidase-like regulatory domain-containing protein n=1 Tax=Porphyromonas gulae TaxID=111105 RepID=UPI000AF81F71|nr:carboxypeptidase-like regulatory domain-containing protein [Porphyromonas gulae]
MPHHLLSLACPLRKLRLFFLYIIIIVPAGYSATAQTVIKGLVLASDNEAPIPYASIYVPETKSGVVADEGGRFILRLQPGRYRLEIRSMGYTSLDTELLVGEKSEDKTFRLSSL